MAEQPDSCPMCEAQRRLIAKLTVLLTDAERCIIARDQKIATLVAALEATECQEAGSR